MQFKIKLHNTGSVALHIYRERTIPDCPNKLFYIHQGEEDMWAVIGRDGQLMSEQETLLYLEVMMIKRKRKRKKQGHKETPSELTFIVVTFSKSVKRFTREVTRTKFVASAKTVLQD
jgi:hypothetical protein